jgi:phage tail tape-measure protein
VFRRLTLATCAVLITASLTSCATFRHHDAAATVNGTTLSQDELGAMASSPVGIALLKEAPVGGSMTGGSARALLGGWISLHAIDDAGLVDQATKDDARKQISEKYAEKWAASPPEMQDLAVLNGAVSFLAQNNKLDQAALHLAVSTAKVTVDPRYGRWDPTKANVIALG